MTRKILYPDQVHGMDLIRASLRAGNRRPILQAPTGYGKTVIAGEIVTGALAKGNRVVFAVPAIELIDQTVVRFGEQGIYDIGVIQANHPMTDWSKPIQVASAQTLMRRKLPEGDLAVVDECHRWFKFYETWFNDPAWKGKPIIGLSATPWTKGLGKHYDDLLIPATLQELIDGGRLSNFRVFAPSHPDLSKVRTSINELGERDYNSADLSKEMDTKVLVADVVKTWIERAKGRPTLCFAVDRAHAAHLCESFTAARVKAAYVDAYTPKDGPDGRKDIAARFAKGEIEVVCNVGVLTTGIDWDVRCIILARPTKSEMLFVQMIGRGLRLADGKDHCLILDHSDTHLRLGFVTDIRHEKLHDGKPPDKKTQDRENEERDERLPKACPQCAHLIPINVHVCPSCGFSPQKKNGVSHKDGELVEFISRAKRKDPNAPTEKTWSMAEKEAWLAQLRWYARDKKYAEGWAFHKYKEKFGKEPSPMLGNPAPVPPTPEVASWIRSRQIAWAKSKKRGGFRAA